jgi:membrane-bound lytic murein transglycosylase
MVYWGTTRAPEYATESNSHQLAQQANDMQQRSLQNLTAEYHAIAVGGGEIPTRPDSLNSMAQKQAQAESDNAVLAANIGVQAENQRREDTDMKTATLLGYDSWWVSANAAMDGTAMARRKADMRAELEEDRYFVVLTAFDYQKLVKDKKSKFLWEVRFSIREHGTQFDKRLPAMIALASDFFGRNSKGLKHVVVPEGKVEIGPVESLGEVSGK